MKRNLLSFSLVIGSLIGCNSPSPKKTHSMGDPPHTFRKLSQSEHNKAAREAESGNARAALMLAHHYGYIRNIEYKDLYDHWIKKARDLGASEAATDIFLDSLRERDCIGAAQDFDRLEFGNTKLANDHVYSKLLVEDCKKIEVYEEKLAEERDNKTSSSGNSNNAASN